MRCCGGEEEEERRGKDTFVGVKMRKLLKRDGGGGVKPGMLPWYVTLVCYLGMLPWYVTLVCYLGCVSGQN